MTTIKAIGFLNGKKLNIVCYKKIINLLLFVTEKKICI